MLREYKETAPSLGSGKTHRPWLLARQTRVRTETRKLDCVAGNYNPSFNGQQIACLER